MTTLPEQLAVCDMNIAKWATQLGSDDIGIQEKARRRINDWLDTRLVLMRGEEDQCVSSQRSASVPS